MSAPDLDFRFEHPNGPYRFLMRAAVILLRGGELLVCREPQLAVCYLPGGRIQAGEDSEAAARREFREETGQTLGDLRLKLITEEFFSAGPVSAQGTVFYYLAPEVPRLPAGSFANLSEPQHWFEWISLDALAEAELVPPFLCRLVPTWPAAGLRHLVSRR